MIDMYDESPAPAGSISSAKLGFAVALLGFFLTFFYPLITQDGIIGIIGVFGITLFGFVDDFSMAFIGLFLMVGGFLFARKEFQDEDNRKALALMAGAMGSCAILYFIWKQALDDPTRQIASIFIEMKQFSVIGMILVFSSFFVAMAIGFQKLNIWSNLSGMKLSSIGCWILSCVYLILVLAFLTLDERKGPDSFMFDMAEVLPYIGSLTLMGGIAMTLFSNCTVLEGDAEDYETEAEAGISMAFQGAGAASQTPWTSMTSADLLGVLTNHTSYTRPELEEAAMELYKRHDEHYLSAFRAMDSTALEAIIKSPASHLRAEVLAAADALATR